MKDWRTCGSHVKGIKVFIERSIPSTVYLFKKIAGACRGLRQLAARHNDNRFLIRTDCKFDDMYFVVLVLRLWADCALGSARRTHTRCWLVLFFEHSLVGDVLICAPSIVILLVLLQELACFTHPWRLPCSWVPAAADHAFLRTLVSSGPCSHSRPHLQCSRLSLMFFRSESAGNGMSRSAFVLFLLWPLLTPILTCALGLIC